MGNITKDIAYDAVAPDDFKSMMDVDRYNARSTAFDKIISATHDHFWDPLDKKYIDFATPFDLENEYIMPPWMNLDLQTEVGQRLDEKQKIRLVNSSMRWGTCVPNRQDRCPGVPWRRPNSSACPCIR